MDPTIWLIFRHIHLQAISFPNSVKKTRQIPNLVPVHVADGAGVQELLAVPPVDVEVGDVDAVLAGGARVVRVPLGGDAHLKFRRIK